MELTDEQIRSIRGKLKFKECPYCKSTRQRKMAIVELPLLLCLKRPIPINSIMGQAEDVAAIATECPDCAYMMLFNLKTLLELKDE